jgi:hypothetical protein
MTRVYAGESGHKHAPFRSVCARQSDPMTAIADPPAAAITGQGRPGARPGRKIFRTAGSVALVAAIFGFAVPHFASYRSVWASMHAMTWPQILLVAAAAAASMITTWIMICSVLPSIRLREAAVVNLGSNAVANTLPAGAGQPAEMSPPGQGLAGEDALRQNQPGNSAGP